MMNKAEYAEYLKSDHWQERRKQMLGFTGRHCQLCNSNGKTLDVHHNNYDRVGSEWVTDLIVLCRPCHERHHDIGDSPTSVGSDEWKNELLTALDQPRKYDVKGVLMFLLDTVQHGLRETMPGKKECHVCRKQDSPENDFVVWTCGTLMCRICVEAATTTLQVTDKRKKAAEGTPSPSQPETFTVPPWLAEDSDLMDSAKSILALFLSGSLGDPRKGAIPISYANLSRRLQMDETDAVKGVSQLRTLAFVATARVAGKGPNYYTLNYALLDQLKTEYETSQTV